MNSYLLLFILLLFPGSLLPAQEKEAMQVRLDTCISHQHMDGFGASDAWRAQFVGRNWPLGKREYIADLLFSQEFDTLGNPRGIGLSLWRFYLSAGSAEQGDDSEIGSQANPWRRGECFLNADGSYDWNKQEGQRWFLQAASERGVEKFLAFTNSPPVHFTANGKGFAPEGVIHLNLKPGFLDDYARYMAEVVEHFEQEEGISFDYLSPVNEPQWDWDGHSQEGTPALNEEIYALCKYLSHELSSRGLGTRIVIPEAGTIGHAALSMRMLGMPADGRDDQARFFFSKESPFYIGNMGNVEGLQHDGKVRESKLLWVLGNFSRFIRPGMHRISCELSEEQSPVDGVLASAYKDPANGSIVAADAIILPARSVVTLIL